MFKKCAIGILTALIAFRAIDLGQAREYCDSNTEFLCKNGKCIVKSLQCDFANDCSDESDEENCIRKQCLANEFICKNGECIPNRLSPRCDVTTHCKDNSDEDNCEDVVCQNETEFRCGSGQCILSMNRCDGNMDCTDKTDEANCTTTECSYRGFKCDNGECIRRGGLCNSIMDCTDSSDESKINCPDGSTPKIWQEFWHGTNQADNENLTLMYDDEYAAVYFGANMNKFITWPFEFLSHAWKYVQRTYGVFGQNPRLYIVLHDRSILTTEPQCSQYVFVDKIVGLPNLIDCAQTNHGPGDWTLDNPANFQKLLFSLANMVQKGAGDMLNDADMSVCGDQMKAIVIYDLYLHLNKTLQLASLMEWVEPDFLKALELKFKFSNKSCFIDWFLPIYRNHGGTSTIARFFNVTKLYGKYRSPGKYGGYYNLKVGEFIHFWSEAANIDLQPLGAKAINWTSQFNDELIQARNSTWHTYTVNNFTLTYADEQVDFYSEPNSTYPFSPYPTISKSWEYYQKTYGPFKDHLTLSIILRKQTWNPLGLNASCITSNITYCGASTGFFNVVDCGASLFKDENGLLDSVATQMGKMVLSLSQGNDGGIGTGSWPAFTVSQWSITSILVYDLYLHLGLQRQGADANRWLGKHLHGVEEPLLRYESQWFNDFYVKIYNSYGKTKVLKTFISNLHQNSPQKTVDADSKSDVTQSQKQINFGEFIHFWSSAANVDLRNLAKNGFGWNDTFQTQFVKARISTQGQGHKYPCNKDCDELPRSDSGNNNVRLGIGIGAAIIGIIVVFAAFGYKIHSDKKVIRDLSQQIRDLTTEEVEEFINGNGNIYSREAHAPIQSLPFQHEYEIPRERLVIEESNHLGSGEFGVVKRGVLKGDEELGIRDTVVAVKTVKPNIEVSYFKAFLVEIKIMAFVGRHENIASLLGTVTQNIVNRKVFVALEFCAKGDLLRHLRENRDHFVNFWKKEIRVDSKVTYQTKKENENDPSSVNIVIRRRSNEDGESASNYSNFSKISTMNLITWSQQISNGMAYLSSKEVIHGDLAARNILLTENNVAKISDFGLSRQLVNYSHYKKSVSTTPLPWKWLAIESLTDMTFSIHSDIWAFGVTLWEIFNLGKVPYPGRNWDHEFVDELAAGLRLESPEFGNKEIYNLMLHCMAKKPTQRNTFPQIHSRLEKIGECLSSAEANASRDFCYISLEE